MTDTPHAKALTAEDRLRLHTHDPETFTFDISDALSLEEELDQLRNAHARALVEAEARGIEKAAKVAEDTTQAPPQRNSKDLWVEDIGKRVSCAIRKLKETTNEQ